VRADRRLLALPLLLAVACGPARVLTRPEGNGGWSEARRRDELEHRATAAGVAFDPEAPPPGPDDVDTPLSLGGALALATTGNRRIAEAERSVDAAAARVRDARGRLLPETIGTGRYNAYTDPLRNNVSIPTVRGPNGEVLFGGPASFVIRQQRSGRLNATTAIPLDVTGQIWKTLTAAQAGYRGERARAWATTLMQKVAAIRAYFELLEAERLRVVVEQNVALDREQLANAQSRYDAGRLTRNELLVVQVSLQDREQELRRRDLVIDQARRALNEVVGRPVDAPTRVLDVEARPDLPAVDTALRDAFANNPVLAALLEEQQRLEDTASALARSRLPRLEGGGTFDWTSETILQPRTIGSGFVGFSWDLGTNDRRAAQQAEARIQAERNRLAIERELRELEGAVRDTRDAAAERLDALDTARAAVGQAEENLRIRRQQFDAGRATSEDVLDAQALLTRQRATLAVALYQAHTRRAELQELMGLPLEALAAVTR
jgi:outer membrane protein